jgi:hypothetical protein
MKHNKKAVFYTVAAIAITAVIFITYSSFSDPRLNERMDPIETRIETVNFFLKDVEDDLSKGAYIAAFRTFLGFNQFIVSNGTYMVNLESKFKESFLNGTMNGIPVDLMQNSTFTDWAGRISAQAAKTDIEFGFGINDVSLNQTDPWNIDIIIDINLIVNDAKNTSSWSKNKTIITKINLIGFEDPTYSVETSGLVSNTIQVSNLTSFVIGGNPANLLVQMNSSYYIASNQSPSYLMRLEGDLGNSDQGIESLVNLEELQGQGISLKDRSIVDYIYFGAQNTVNYRINQTPFWFKIDSQHLDTYQVTNITI